MLKLQFFPRRDGPDSVFFLHFGILIHVTSLIKKKTLSYSLKSDKHLWLNDDTLHDLFRNINKDDNIYN